MVTAISVEWECKVVTQKSLHGRAFASREDHVVPSPAPDKGRIDARDGVTSLDYSSLP